MLRFRSSFVATAVAILVATVALGPAAGLPPTAHVPEVAAGFVVTPLVPVAAPTAIAFGPGGADGPDLYATTLAGDVVRVSLTWTPAGPIVDGVSTFASGFSQPLGLAFDGDRLFVADSHPGEESERTDGRVTLVDGDERIVVVDGLPNGRHNTNHLRFGPDGRLYVTNGNPNDNGVDGGDADVFPYSGAILSVDADEVATSPAILRWVDENGDPIPESQIAAHPLNADFASKVDVLAWGFRNVFGVTFSPEGVAYTATNGADDPGSQDALYRIDPGTDYGFPFCYKEGPPGGVGDDVVSVPNPIFPDADCSGVATPTALLGWHVCATGLDFPTAGASAFPAGMHGSVFVAECGPFFLHDTIGQGVEAAASLHNTGHKVVRVDLDENGEAVAVQDFVTGLALPTDVLFGPDGAMYVADIEALHRVAPAAPAAGGLPEVPVAAAGFWFASPAVVVAAGQPVRWDGVLLPHTVTTAASIEDAAVGRANDRLNSDADPDTFHGRLPQGTSFTHAFTEPGTYAYFCELHYRFGMVGEVVVV